MWKIILLSVVEPSDTEPHSATLMWWRYEARYDEKIYKLAALLFTMQGSKRVKKVAA